MLESGWTPLDTERGRERERERGREEGRERERERERESQVEYIRHILPEVTALLNVL